MNQFKGGLILPFPNHAKIFDFQCIETKFRVNHFENNWNRIRLFLKNSFYNFLFCNLSSKKCYKLPTEESVQDPIRYDEWVHAAEIKINTNSAIKAQNQVKGMLHGDKGFVLEFKAFKMVVVCGL